MKHPILAPSVGESITEVSILKWRKSSGDAVQKGEVILEIESDKATVEVIAEATGAITIEKQEGERVGIGAQLGFVDDAVAGKVSAAAAAPAPAPTTTQTQRPAPAAASSSDLQLSPSVRRMAAEQGMTDAQLKSIPGTGKDGRLTKGDLMSGSSSAAGASPSVSASMPAAAPPRQLQAGERRVPMTRLRQKIAERLVHAQHTAAILTTFNECDLTAVMQLRSQHKDAFKTKNGVALSFMSFFTRAAVEALKAQPVINASIEGTDVIYRDHVDMGIAVGTDRGLVVPVVRSADRMNFVDIERAISDLAVKARDGKLSIAEMSGGTFTISNGGTYGSLLSTPILNPPQSGILGMHKIMERPVVINGKIEARPMMYLALSYDHRLIDGKEAVTFLVTLKDLIENPMKLKPEFV